MRLNFHSKFTLFLLGFVVLASAAFSQPSLNPVDQLVLGVKNERNRDEAFTVIRDANIGEVFYIVPGRPRLEVRGSGDDARPVFHLVKYQYQDKARDIPAGAVMQFSVTFEVPQIVRDNLGAKIKEIYKLKQMRFAPFPIKSSQIKFYSLEGKALETEDDSSATDEGTTNAAGIGPGFGTQSFPFQVKLKDLNADLYEALVQGHAGLPVLMTITYQGLTPRLGCKITANFEKIFDSLDVGLSSGGSFACPFMDIGSQGDYGLDLKKLENNNSVKIESTTGEGFTNEEFDAIRDLIMPKIYAELFDTEDKANPFPPEIPSDSAQGLAESQNPNAPNPLAGLGSIVGEVASGASSLSKLAASMMQGSGKARIKFSLKAKKQIKKGSFTFDMNKRSLVERTCSFGTCLNISEYLKYKDELISEIIAGGWAKAFFTLPTVADPESLDIKDITMNITPMLNGKHITNLGAQSARFKAGESDWVDRDGNPIRKVVFPMSAMFKNKGKKDVFNFVVDGTVALNKARKSITFKQEVPMINGDFPVVDPQSFIEVVTIDGFMLDFVEKGEAGPVRISGKLIASKPNFTQNFILSSDQPRVDLVLPPEPESVKLQLTFKRGDGKTVKHDAVLKTAKGQLNEFFELDNEMWLLPSEKLEEVADAENLIYNDLFEQQ